MLFGSLYDLPHSLWFGDLSQTKLDALLAAISHTRPSTPWHQIKALFLRTTDTRGLGLPRGHLGNVCFCKDPASLLRYLLTGVFRQQVERFTPVEQFVPVKGRPVWPVVISVESNEPVADFLRSVVGKDGICFRSAMLSACDNGTTPVSAFFQHVLLSSHNNLFKAGVRASKPSQQPVFAELSTAVSLPIDLIREITLYIDTAAFDLVDVQLPMKVVYKWIQYPEYSPFHMDLEYNPGFSSPLPAAASCCHALTNKPLSETQLNYIRTVMGRFESRQDPWSKFVGFARYGASTFAFNDKEYFSWGHYKHTQQVVCSLAPGSGKTLAHLLLGLIVPKPPDKIHLIVVSGQLIGPWMQQIKDHIPLTHQGCFRVVRGLDDFHFEPAARVVLSTDYWFNLLMTTEDQMAQTLKRVSLFVVDQAHIYQRNTTTEFNLTRVIREYATYTILISAGCEKKTPLNLKLDKRFDNYSLKNQWIQQYQTFQPDLNTQWTTIQVLYKRTATPAIAAEMDQRLCHFGAVSNPVLLRRLLKESQTSIINRLAEKRLQTQPSVEGVGAGPQEALAGVLRLLKKPNRCDLEQALIYCSSVETAQSDGFLSILRLYGTVTHTCHSNEQQNLHSIAQFMDKGFDLLVLTPKYARGLDFPGISVMIICTWDDLDDIKQVTSRMDRFGSISQTVYVLTEEKGPHQALMGHATRELKRKRTDANQFRACQLANVTIHVMGDDPNTFAWMLKSTMLIFAKFAVIEDMLESRQVLSAPVTEEEKLLYRSITNIRSLELTSLEVTNVTDGWMLVMGNSTVHLSHGRQLYNPRMRTSMLEPLSVDAVITDPRLLTVFSYNREHHATLSVLLKP